MATDSIILALRRYFDLTQSDLARYLGVSRTLLAHAEGGRRNLPSEASWRRLPLLGLLPPYGSPKQPAPPDPAEYSEQGIDDLRWRLKVCWYEAQGLDYQLLLLRRRVDAVRRRRTLPALLTALPARPPLPGLLPDLALPPAPPNWATRLAADATMKLPRCGQLAQSLLEARLAGINAEITHLEALVAALPPTPSSA